MKKIIIIITAVVMTALAASAGLNIGYADEATRLSRSLERRDAFIREYLDTLYRLKDEFVLNESNERTIHALDSLGYGLGKETGIFDYTLYALDVNHLQEKLRREAEERCAGR